MNPKALVSGSDVCVLRQRHVVRGVRQALRVPQRAGAALARALGRAALRLPALRAPLLAAGDHAATRARARRSVLLTLRQLAHWRFTSVQCLRLCRLPSTRRWRCVLRPLASMHVKR